MRKRRVTTNRNVIYHDCHWCMWRRTNWITKNGTGTKKMKAIETSEKDFLRFRRAPNCSSPGKWVQKYEAYGRHSRSVENNGVIVSTQNKENIYLKLLLWKFMVRKLIGRRWLIESGVYFSGEVLSGTTETDCLIEFCVGSDCNAHTRNLCAFNCISKVLNALFHPHRDPELSSVLIR